MQAVRAGLVVLLASVCTGARLGADDWPAPRPITLFTAAAERLVRILPGDSVGDLVGFAGAPKGAMASAEIYARQPDRSYRFVRAVTLVNPVAPVNALLAPDGVRFSLLTFMLFWIQ